MASGPLVSACGAVAAHQRLDSHGLLFQLEDLMYGPQSGQSNVTFDERGDFDFAGCDHLDIDLFVGQGGKHTIGHSCLAGHSQTDNRDLSHLVVMRDLASPDDVGGLADCLQSRLQFAAGDRKRDVRLAFFAHVLHDHVDSDFVIRQAREDFEARAGHVRHSYDCDAGFLGSHGGTANRLVVILRLFDDHRARDVAEAAPHVNGDREFLGELDRTIVHHASSQAGQFEHFVVADLLHSPRFRKDSWVGRVDAVDVGVDFALFGTQHGSQSHRRRVTAAAPQRRNVVQLIDPLEASGNYDVAFVQQLLDAGRRNRPDASLGVRVVRDNPDLCAGQADCFVTQRVHRHRHQGHTDLFAGRE